MKYKSKPAEIEAIRYTGENIIEIMAFMNVPEIEDDLLEDWISIKTPEGAMRANPGDWIIKGTIGEFYPCKDKVFKQKYEPVEVE